MNYLSPSKINMLRRCGAQYYFRYVEGLKSPPAMPLVRGRATDRGLEHNFEYKIETNLDAPIEEVLDAASDEFETAFVDLEPKDKKEIDKDFEKDDVMTGIKLYHKEEAPKIKKPVSTQKKIDMELLPNWGMIGYIDLLSHDMLIDFKNVGKKPPLEPRFDYWLQMSIYDMALRLDEGIESEKIELQYIVRPTKTLPHRIFKHEIESNDKLVDATINGAISTIEAGIFPPCRDNVLCSKRFCGYWNECEKMYGGKVKD